MRKLRVVAVGSLLALVVAASPSSAAPPAGVKGGGFLRDAANSKTTLTINATDDMILGDRGQARFMRHTPGSRPDSVHITVQCVQVVDSTALAAGFGSDGNMYLIAVKDNGQGHGKRDEFAVVETALAVVQCLSSGVPISASLGSVQGGNYQVSSGN